MLAPDSIMINRFFKKKEDRKLESVDDDASATGADHDCFQCRAVGTATTLGFSATFFYFSRNPTFSKLAQKSYRLCGTGFIYLAAARWFLLWPFNNIYAK
uniref:DUF4536 domain-containing protein n=1 Tax=Romanomermis culicivorax TaxID=13658 RepID=A0A915JPS0_ROMCU